MENVINDIDVQNVSFKYDANDELATFVLKGIDIHIKKGEVTAILGHNGCGKSTLAKLFNAINLPVIGEVFVGGINTKDHSRVYDIRQEVGMVFQNPDNQIVATIVEEDVSFALENLGVPPDVIRQEIDIAMKKTGVYSLKDKAVYELSGGQKQRVAIAGIIAMRPSFIILDEPTAMLDPKGRREVMSTIKELNEKHNITIVIITHYMEEACKANRVIVMDKGNIVMDDIPSEVFSRVETLKSIGLDIPQTTELIYELRKEGFDLPLNIIDEETCISHISKLLSNS